MLSHHHSPAPRRSRSYTQPTCIISHDFGVRFPVLEQFFLLSHKVYYYKSRFYCCITTVPIPDTGVVVRWKVQICPTFTQVRKSLIHQRRMREGRKSLCRFQNFVQSRSIPHHSMPHHSIVRKTLILNGLLTMLYPFVRGGLLQNGWKSRKYSLRSEASPFPFDTCRRANLTSTVLIVRREFSSRWKGLV